MTQEKVQGADTLNDIQAIRSILMGQQIEAYEKRFAAIDTHVQNLEKEVDKNLSAVKTQSEAELNTALKSIKKELSTTQEHTQAQFKELKAIIETQQVSIEKLIKFFGNFGQQFNAQ